MTGCCVPLCTGGTYKGNRVFRFPREKNRRKIWELQVKRDCWEATDASRICELHFESSQFEQRRADGWRKLKYSAVPTLFPGDTKASKQQTQQEMRSKRQGKRHKVNSEEPGTDDN
ncbi:peroxynitrite isomerase THAP4 [Rhipicephalus sanguineus]|uniref:peroxynitrite isomerase THAP4 n=1 Tax=Rhipicephalus sanguineus TaxID=34632 RepID=UPI0020C3058D|nr:peroxynitrite isomerase THAP4 [Rhipicephalus sanguineus]